jgi:hypothetical protein
MSKTSDDFRDRANSARATAGAMSRNDMRRAALDIARGFDRQADEADERSAKPQDSSGD